MFTESGGFTLELSWHLVTQLINHIFIDDMEKVRSFVRDSLSFKRKMEQGVSVLWGTFCTHGVMQEYMSYNIEHHPSIASDYVKFLVLNRGSASDTTEGESDGETASALQARVIVVRNMANPRLKSRLRPPTVKIQVRE